MMMYKDPDKQREAVKLATRRYRAKGITKVSQGQGITGPVESRSQATGEAGELKKAEKPEPQSYCSFRVGYVPPGKGAV